MIVDIAEFAAKLGHPEHLTEVNLKFRMKILSDPRWLRALHLSRREAGRAKVRCHAQLWKARGVQSA